MANQKAIREAQEELILANKRFAVWANAKADKILQKLNQTSTIESIVVSKEEAEA